MGTDCLVGTTDTAPTWRRVMRDQEQPTAAQREVLEALVHHEHLLVLQEGNGVIPRLWVGSADITAMHHAGWIEPSEDLGSTTVWKITSDGRKVLSEAAGAS
jgi:hypothetical protein